MGLSLVAKVITVATTTNKKTTSIILRISMKDNRTKILVKVQIFKQIWKVLRTKSKQISWKMCHCTTHNRLLATIKGRINMIKNIGILTRRTVNLIKTHLSTTDLFCNLLFLLLSQKNMKKTSSFKGWAKKLETLLLKSFQYLISHHSKMQTVETLLMTTNRYKPIFSMSMAIEEVANALKIEIQQIRILMTKS